MSIECWNCRDRLHAAGHRQGPRFAGVASLRDLMEALPEQTVGDLMQPPTSPWPTSPLKMPHGDAPTVGSLALPVVDNERRLVSILTVDDALGILEEADSEDQARISGSEKPAPAPTTTSIGTLVRSRVVWLLVLAIGAALTVQVLTPSSTRWLRSSPCIVRSALTGPAATPAPNLPPPSPGRWPQQDVTPRDIAKVLGREFRVGLSLGLILGSAGFVLTSVIFDRSSVRLSV